jgi:CheY-like chemotaxis protein
MLARSAARGTSDRDLALLDVMMHGMNSIELAMRVQSANPGLPIVLMTGYGSPEIA